MRRARVSRRASLLVASLILLASSACGPPKATNLAPSPHPEITVAGAPKRLVFDEMVARMISDGYQVVRADEYTITFEKPAQQLMDLLFGTRYSPDARYRTTYNVIDTPTGVRVIGSSLLVRNPGTSAEQVTELASDFFQKPIREFLATLRTGIEQRIAASAMPASPAVAMRADSGAAAAGPTEKPKASAQTTLTPGATVIGLDGFDSTQVDFPARPSYTPRPEFPAGIPTTKGTIHAVDAAYVVDKGGAVDMETFRVLNADADPVFVEAVRSALLHWRYDAAFTSAQAVRMIVRKRFEFVDP
jgi:hypothetical protein